MTASMKMAEAPSPRRTEILEAALSCFHDKGVERTKLGDIRARSGASTGSIYHFFAGKDDIFGELLLESYREVNTAILEAVAVADSAEEAVRATVRAYIAWVAADPKRARFLMQAPLLRMSERHVEQLKANNRAFLREVRRHVLARADAGEIRRMPVDIFVAVVLGPMKEYAQQYVSGTSRSSKTAAIRELGSAAWNAVRA